MTVKIIGLIALLALGGCADLAWSVASESLNSILYSMNHHMTTPAP